MQNEVHTFQASSRVCFLNEYQSGKGKSQIYWSPNKHEYSVVKTEHLEFFTHGADFLSHLGVLRPRMLQGNNHFWAPCAPVVGLPFS